MASKMKYEDVKQFIEVDSESGCKLLSDEYLGAKKKLKIECNCGNSFETTFNTFKHNDKRTCDECSLIRFKNKASNKRTTWNYTLAKEYIESFDGHILISKEYIDSISKLEIKCPNNHTFFMNLSDFKREHRCNKCASYKISEKLKYAYEEVKSYIESTRVGHILLSQEYIDGSQNLEIKCDKNHFYHMRFNTIKNSEQGCPQCGIESRSGENHWNWQGGISPERSLIMVKSEYKNWRLSVFKRDSFTCQVCSNESRGDLEAHHLENFSNNESLRLEVSNGITLCKYCHSSLYKGSFHSVYGTRNTNTQMFNEYLIRRKHGEFDDLILSYEGGETRIGKKSKKESLSTTT